MLTHCPLLILYIQCLKTGRDDAISWNMIYIWQCYGCHPVCITVSLLLISLVVEKHYGQCCKSISSTATWLHGLIGFICDDCINVMKYLDLSGISFPGFAKNLSINCFSITFSREFTKLCHNIDITVKK